MTTSSKTAQTFPQRKATAIRRVLGMLALVAVFAFPQAASAQSHSRYDDGKRGEEHAVQHRSAQNLTGAQAARLRARIAAHETRRPATNAHYRGRSDSRAATQGNRRDHRADTNREAAPTRARQVHHPSRQNNGSRGQLDGQNRDGR